MSSIVYLNKLTFASLSEASVNINHLTIEKLQEVLPANEYFNIRQITFVLLQEQNLLALLKFNESAYDNLDNVYYNEDILIPTLNTLQNGNLDLSLILADNLLIIYETERKEETNNMLVARPAISTYESSLINIVQALFNKFSFSVVKTMPQFYSWFTHPSFFVK